MSNAKYLVSGGAGTLGKLIISMLIAKGEKVRILMSELSDVSEYEGNPNIEICYGISTDKDSMNEFFDVEDPRHTTFLHADEYISLSDSTNLTMRRVNVIGAENIVDMCLKRKIGRLVYLSSAYALNPELIGKDTLELHFDRNKVEGEYAKSKAETAAYIMEKVALNRLNAVMVLPTFIIGPGYTEDYEINKILNSYLHGGVAPLKNGGHAFVDVRDVANAMITLTTEGEPGTGYLITGEYKTSEEFFKEVNEVQGIDAPVKTASRLVTSKSLAKFVDVYYRITHKENPKQVYALFSDNPTAKFEDVTNGPEEVIKFKDSINDSINSTALYLSKITEGELGTPRPYSVHHDDVLTLLLLACGVLLLVVVGSSVRTVKNLFKEFFFPSAAEDNDVLTGISPLLFFLCTTTCVVVALCSFIYADSEMEGFFVIDSPIAIVGIFFAAAVVYLLLKWLVYTIVNNVLFGGNKSLQWSRAFFFVTALEGMLLFPLLLMVIYFKLSVEKGLYYFIFVLLLCKILAFFKSRSIFFRQKILFLQNILYFCALEITPLLAFGGAWLILAHFLKVKF